MLYTVFPKQEGEMPQDFPTYSDAQEYGAVSYTHLDVYKRQDWKRGINPGVLRPFKRLVLSETEEHHGSKRHRRSYAAGMQKQQYRILPGT